MLDMFLKAYSAYYDIEKDSPPAPFDATATFEAKAEQYFMVRAARIAEIHSAEYVYFKCMDTLSPGDLVKLDEAAWELGQESVKPGEYHKSTDVTLIILAKKVEGKDFRKLVSKTRHSKSYRFGLWGFCRYRLVVIETESETAFFNFQGRALSDLVADIFKRRR